METQTAQQQGRRDSKASRELSSDELSEIIKEASRRQGAVLQRENAAAGATTLEDAYTLAKELGIPQEYVTEAASSLARKKASTGQLATAKSGRLKRFVLTGVGSAVAFGAALVLGMSGIGLTLLGAVLGIATAAAFVLWLSSVMDSGGKTGDAVPAPGTCRVCLRPAYKPESTFCEEHRFKGPGETT